LPDGSNDIRALDNVGTVVVAGEVDAGAADVGVVELAD
jgi:hypothetical protein